MIFQYTQFSNIISAYQKKAGQIVRQIWKTFRDKINLKDLRKGTLKKMQWETHNQEILFYVIL